MLISLTSSIAILWQIHSLMMSKKEKVKRSLIQSNQNASSMPQTCLATINRFTTLRVMSLSEVARSVWLSLQVAKAAGLVSMDLRASTISIFPHRNLFSKSSLKDSLELKWTLIMCSHRPIFAQMVTKKQLYQNQPKLAQCLWWQALRIMKRLSHSSEKTSSSVATKTLSYFSRNQCYRLSTLMAESCLTLRVHSNWRQTATEPCSIH